MIYAAILFYLLGMLNISYLFDANQTPLDVFSVIAGIGAILTGVYLTKRAVERA